MPGFDVHAPDLELLTNHFIEASAGTGKTYTIEQLVKRLVCEKGLALDEILIVTFTKAATFELKKRIASHGIVGESIFTIHGFCLHALQSHAFESSFPLSGVKIAGSSAPLQGIARDILKSDLGIHPKQLEVLLSMHRQDGHALVAHLTRLASQRIPIAVPPPFSDLTTRMQALSYDPEQLLHDLCTQAPLYGKTTDRQRRLKNEIKCAFEQFVQGEWLQPALLLLQESNRLKHHTPALHYPDALGKLLPLVEEALNPWNILATVAERVRCAIERHISQNECLFFEDLIISMKTLVKQSSFAAAVRTRYRAVFIDEFQDTDPDQWEIFSTLFLGHVPLYLVGDPKQAIYRFRRADIYTYLKAKEQMGHCVSLETNFRSSPPLVEGLNALFADLKFPLPRLGTHLDSPPVQSGKEDLDPLLPPIISLKAHDEASLFSQVISAIEEHPHLSAAVLVKDRYQAQRFAAASPLPVRLHRTRSLLDSEAIERLKEWLRALVDSQDNQVQLLLQGRFSTCTPSQITLWGEMLPQCGILSVMREIIDVTAPSLVRQRGGEMLMHDLLHLAELLEARGGDDLLETLELLCQEDPEQEELKGRQWSEGKAIEVMTIHASKGLEFDLVFPIGLALPPTEKRDLVYCPERHTLSPSLEAWEQHQKELSAEAVRQFYVACTRAKKRLYLPSIEGESACINL